MKKKILSLLLSAAMVLSLSTGLTARAAEPTVHYNDCAQTLYTMGLFRGVGTNGDGSPIFALEREATRMQGLIMLIRLLGEEEAALAYEGDCPFTDVSGNSAKYAGYAFSKGYTAGSTPTSFGNGPLKVNAFLTFTLRALGYDDKAGDFTYGTALQKADDVALVEFTDFRSGSEVMRRDDCARVAYNALLTNLKSGESNLLDSLVAAGAIDGEKAASTGIFDNAGPDYLRFYDPAAAHKNGLEQMRRDLTYYGLPADTQWVDEMKTLDDLMNNMYICYLNGDYPLDLPLPSRDALDKFYGYYDGMARYDIFALHPELTGSITNMTHHFYDVDRPDGSVIAIIEVENAVQSWHEVFAQAREGKAAAEAMIQELKTSGKLTDGQTQLEQTQVLYDYLQSQNIQAGGGPDEPEGSNMRYDTVYATLVNKSSSCTGRAAATNALLHLLGIPAVGVQGHHNNLPEGMDHVLTIAMLDGREYAIDWGNQVPICTVEEYSKDVDFTFFESSLALARATLK